MFFFQKIYSLRSYIFFKKNFNIIYRDLDMVWIEKKREVRQVEETSTARNVELSNGTLRVYWLTLSFF